MNDLPKEREALIQRLRERLALCQLDAATEQAMLDAADALSTPAQAVPLGAREVIEQCRAALAEELGAWDIDPPLFHVKEAHDACVAWLAAAPQQPAPSEDARDAARLRFLEDLTRIGWAPQVLYDDNGKWFVSTSGSMPIESAGRVWAAVHDIDAKWQPSIRAAIDDAKRRYWPKVAERITAMQAQEGGNAAI